MGALRLYSSRSAIGAKGGIMAGLAKIGAKGAMRSIPGVGLASTAFSAGKLMMPKKPGFGTGLVTGMASGPATRIASSTARQIGQKAQAAWSGRKKYRRVNVGNMKALKRAIRRIVGAEKLFRQVLSVQGKSHTGIKPKKGRK